MRRSILQKILVKQMGWGNTIHYNPSPHLQNKPTLKSLKHFTKKEKKKYFNFI